MIVFVTYSNDLYAKTRDFCAAMAVKKGRVDRSIVYKPEDIDTAFYEKHKDILDLRAGNGLWLWKPYFVCKALDTVNEGDIVLYCDAGSYFFRSCKPIIDSMTDDIWVSNIPLVEKQFTKPELMEKLGCNTPEYFESNQVQGNFIAVRKTERGLKFAHEWLAVCEDGDNLLTDTRYHSNPPEFIFFGHRSDQSVLSLLSKKWGLNIHLDPSQYGRVPEKYYAEGRIYKVPEHSDKYAPCIILHRKKDADFKTRFNQWVFTWIPKSMMGLISNPVRQVRSMEGKK